MSDVEIVVARDFTPYPQGRYATDSPWSGEVFRKKHLGPALRDNDIVTVVLDGAMGYGSSFLEEAFGGLIREGFSRTLITSKLNLISDIPFYVDDINRYLREAEERNGN